MADHCIPASGYLMRPYSEEHLPCIVSKYGNNQGCQRGDRGKQRHSVQKRFDMLFRILIVFLLRQKRETDAFCTAPPEQIDHEEIEQALPMLRELSGDIRTVKEQVLDNFRQILDMKADVLKRTKDGQKSHTFTNSTGDKRITIGRCVVDGWRDTVEDGIAIVKEAVMGLIKDDETKAMINQIMRLIARDQNGNLKASKVLQLDTLAEELHNERLNEGIAIIKESYIPNLSKTYIRAEWKDDNGVWRYVPLGMTEA